MGRVFVSYPLDIAKMLELAVQNQLAHLRMLFHSY